MICLAYYVLYSFTNTLQRLDLVEFERDQWQRPLDVVRALREGHTVADLGAGSGYFSLKLSSAVGDRGHVLAVDIRKLSLFFLWARALLRGQHNVRVIVGTEDNPRLPIGAVDAVLICNTYHEFRNPDMVINQTFRSLRRGGRLVVVDRARRANAAEQAHEVLFNVVESELRQNGFEIVTQDDHFIDRSGDNAWWLVKGRKP